MGYGLGVCCNTVVASCREVDMGRSEAGEDFLNFVEAFLGGAVLDEDLVGLDEIEKERRVQ